MAAAAERAGAAVLYVSSDYVFDGRKHEPYADFPRPAPRPAYSVPASERSNAIALPAWQEGLDAYPAERKVRA